MDTLQAAYRDEDEDMGEASTLPPPPSDTLSGDVASNDTALPTPISTSESKPPDQESEKVVPESDHANGVKEEPEATGHEYLSSDEISVYGTPQAPESDQNGDSHDTPNSPNAPPETDGDGEGEGQGEEDDQNEQNGTLHSPISRPETDGEGGAAEEGKEEEDGPPPKKQKQLSDLPTPQTSEIEVTEIPSPADAITPENQNGKPPASKSSKKSKKKSKDVWTTTTRKGKKKTKHASNSIHNSRNGANGNPSAEDKVLITPIPRFPDKNDDSPDLNICLSKVYKAEKVELSDDRLTAGSTKGYRMVRATRGVTEGAWYFEIKVVHLGETGHTRLGWSTDKGDLQAPVGYDENSFGYRDIDGSKVHKALREKYGEEGYKEGDVIGFYINLPNGGSYAPDPPRLVWYKGQRYVCAPDPKDGPPKIVPGSEISYFKNGICQGVAFTDLYGGRYFPAASMYTLPGHPNCTVKFNFGPDFEMFPDDFGERPVPKPMSEVPYQGYDGRVENGNHPWNVARMCPTFKGVKEGQSRIVKAAEMVALT